MMIFWNAGAFGGNAGAPADVLQLIDLLSPALTARTARIIKAGRGDPDEDEPWIYLLFELAPGVTLPFNYYVFPEQHLGALDPRQIVRVALEGVTACASQVGRLSDILHDARVRARRVIGAWHAEGLSTQLIDVRLSPYDFWVGDPNPKLTVKLLGHDGRLEPAPETIRLVKPDELEQDLAAWRSGFEACRSLRAELALLGATGRTDQYAINALARFGDPATGLRRFARDWRFWLPDDTCLLLSQGRVTAGSADPNALADIRGSQFTIRSHHLPETRLRAAIGRPVTELVTHPFLSPDMMVLEASCDMDEGQPFIALRLDIPQFLFCWISGRYWKDDWRE